MKRLYLTMAMCALAFAIFACGGKPEEAFKNLSADEFERLIEDEEVQCVDVRTVAEYSEGHIQGSLNVNVLDKHFINDAEEVLDTDRPVAVYCRSGRRSRDAARQLSEKGYTVFNLDKGFEDWKKEGKRIEK